ncbi:MAG TPA: hypothetical protein VF691_07390 [Cytophagaceae bacterium]|jgi:hypothetical protein
MKEVVKLMQAPEIESMERLFKEADSIINSCTDEDLKNIWNRIIKWRNDGSNEEKYYNEFIKVTMAMSLLNFKERMPYLNNGKTLLNLISHTINHVAEELQGKVFPMELLTCVFQEMDLTDLVIILTDYEGMISYCYPGFVKLPMNLTGVKIESLFKDKKVFQDLKLYQPKDGVLTQLKYFDGKPVNVKAISTHFKYAEGIAYLIKIQ